MQSPARNRPTSLRDGGAVCSPVAAMCRGTSRRSTSQPSGRTETAIAATQDTKTPVVGTAAAHATSRPSFTAENAVLPTGTHSALRSPVSTPSWRVSRFQAITAAMKPSPFTGPSRKPYDGPNRSSVSRNPPAASATTSELAA
ncbi:hypothetical protein SGLAM104S_00923 [Streptomyces glaucescens]